MWFDPGVGHVLPGEVLEYHRAANVLSVQAVIAGKVSNMIFFLLIKFYNKPIRIRKLNF